MVGSLRIANVLVGVVSATLAVGFLIRAPWALRVWPFAATETRLGFTFLGSIAAAVAASAIWIGLSGEVRATAGGSMNLMVTFWGMSMFLVGRGFSSGRPDLVHAAAACGLLGAALGGTSILARRIPWQDQDQMSPVVRFSFLAFSALLTLVALALLVGAPHIFPWPLAHDSSVMYGWIFLGAAVYFAYGVFQPMRANATGQLLGFLAYDLVLIAPFLKHFATVNRGHQLSLIIYTAALIYSGVLAIYYLFVHTPGRLGHVNVPTTRT